jgi:Ran-binding protein 3
MAAAAAAAAENNNTIESDVLVFDPATPIAISDEVPTAPASPADVDAAAVSPEYNVEKLQARSTSPRSGSDSGDPDKSLKRKLADRGTSHGPENGDAVKATDDSETLKHARDEDDNPRAKKRPTPPRTPEPINALDGQKRPTPPATPPSDSDDLSKLAEPSTRPRDDSDNDAIPRQTKKPSPPPEQTPREEPRTTTPKLVRNVWDLVIRYNISLESLIPGRFHGIRGHIITIRVRKGAEYLWR